MAELNLKWQQGVPRPPLRKHGLRERCCEINVCCFHKVGSQTSTMDLVWALVTTTQQSHGRSNFQEFTFFDVALYRSSHP